MGTWKVAGPSGYSTAESLRIAPYEGVFNNDWHGLRPDNRGTHRPYFRGRITVGKGAGLPDPDFCRGRPEPLGLAPAPPLGSVVEWSGVKAGNTP